MVDRATANSSPQTATGHKQDDQIVKTKLPAGSCSRVLDQSLGSTRAHQTRNQPLEQPCTSGGLRKGGLDVHSTHVHLNLVCIEHPIRTLTRCAWSRARRVGTLRLVQWIPLSKGRHTWFISASNKTLATVPFPAGMIGRSLRPQIRVQHERSGVVTAGDRFRRPLGLSC